MMETRNDIELAHSRGSPASGSELHPRILQDAAAEVARLAGALLKNRFDGTRQIEFKGGIDPVTDSDRASEECIIRYITRRFPEHGILAEERGLVAAASREKPSHRWLIDPLDGTVNYAHRVPHFSVSIAVEDDKGVVAGAVFDPMRSELFEAGRGLGARLNGKALSVSNQETMGRALLATGFPYSVWSESEKVLDLLKRFLGKAQGIRRAGSAALDLCYVASGRFDGFFELSLNPWDVAAGMLIVQEAGGTVTDLSGAPLELTTGKCNLLSSNRLLHEEMLEISRLG